jgi:hyaluronan synthase
VVSSLFLMPIRLLGFFRLAHAGSWGTRENAYTAEPDTVDLASNGPERPGRPNRHTDRDRRDPLLDELDGLSGGGPADIVDRADRRQDIGPGGSQRNTVTDTVTETVTAETSTGETRPSVRHPQPRPIAPPTRHGPNLQAGIPYLIGFTIVTAEVLYHG